MQTNKQKTAHKLIMSSNNTDSDDSFSNDDSTANTGDTPTTENEVCIIFQTHQMEEENSCILYQVRKTIRERIFPLLKFCTESVLQQVKLNERNNILHMSLADLNRLDNSSSDRARFWIRYKGEIRSVLCTRRTEVSNNIKETVLNGEFIIDIIESN